MKIGWMFELGSARSNKVGLVIGRRAFSKPVLVSITGAVVSGITDPANAGAARAAHIREASFI